MQFSRSHTGMLAVVSLFTGMIAPVLNDGARTYPLPLTDMQWFAYTILILLVAGFYLVSTNQWRAFSIIGTIISIIIVYLFAISITGNIHNQFGGTLEHMSWGWIFLAVGIGLLGLSIIGNSQEKDVGLTLFVDHILGVIGSFTLFCLALLIAYISYTPVRSDRQELILPVFFGSGNIEYISGSVLSPSFDEIRSLSFDRKTGQLRFIASHSGITSIYPGTGKEFPHPYSLMPIGKKVGVIQSDGGLSIDEKFYTGTVILPQFLENTISIQTASGLLFIDENGETIFPGKHKNIQQITRSKDAQIFAWTEQTDTGIILKKNNETIGHTSKSIESIALSRSGYDIMALTTNQIGEKEITKNGVRIEQVLSGYVDGTFQSNGSHSIYVNDVRGIKTIIYDGGVLRNQFEEVREIFLERSGNSYAFFARPLGEKKYCLFTRYRGNLCGLDGYMNPRLGADGGSVLYAGLKDGIWSIYRNTDAIIKDTSYHGINISNDYAFFDTTNPRQYLFIEKTIDGNYLYRKNGKILPGIWQDVSLDVWFGYDNKIITSAKDTRGWRIIEM